MTVGHLLGCTVVMLVLVVSLLVVETVVSVMDVGLVSVGSLGTDMGGEKERKDAPEENIGDAEQTPITTEARAICVGIGGDSIRDVFSRKTVLSNCDRLINKNYGL